MSVSIANLRYTRKFPGVCKVAFRLDRLNKLMKANKIKQGELAKAVGVSSRMIRNYRKGQGVPDIEHLTLLANALGTNTYYLQGLTTYDGPLGEPHFKLADAFQRGDTNGVLDILRQHLAKQNFAKKIFPRVKPGSES